MTFKCIALKRKKKNLLLVFKTLLKRYERV